MRRFILAATLVLLVQATASAQAITQAMCDAARQDASDARDAAESEYAAAASAGRTGLYMVNAAAHIRYNTPTLVRPGVFSVPSWEIGDSQYDVGDQKRLEAIVHTSAGRIIEAAYAAWASREAFGLAYIGYTQSLQIATVARRNVQSAVNHP